MPSTPVIQEGHQAYENWVESQANECHPEWESGVDCCHTTDDQSGEENYEHLRLKSPKQGLGSIQLLRKSPGTLSFAWPQLHMSLLSPPPPGFLL